MSVSTPQHRPGPAAGAAVLRGASMLVEALKREGVEVIFGYPGGAVLTVYDALYDAGIPHILTRHEQGAIHAAEGYARVSGKPGVVIATSGPGATNLVTGLADAMMDSLPLVVITGQVATDLIGTDAFQETSTLGITMPITKHNYQVRDVAELPMTIKEAFHIASTGRPGPVLIDLPKDITNAMGLFDYDRPVHIPGYQPTIVPNRLQIRKIVAAIKQAKRPVILAGAGVLHAGAHEWLRKFVERVRIPVVHTLLGLGGFPASHPLFLGMGGMHGTYAANMAMYEADLLINIGARFDDRLTGNLAHFARQAKVAHIDIDPAEIGKNVETDIPVVGDAGEALKMLLEEDATPGDYADWVEYLLNLKREFPLWYVPDGKTLKPQRLIEMIHQMTAGDAIIVTDVGQHQMWAAQFYPFEKPRRFVTSGGLGTMGFGLPAAIGAQIAARDSRVFAVLGDGGFQMTLQELIVLTEYQLPVKVVIVNNTALGMVRQWQELFYSERYSQSLMPVQPDYLKLAEAYHMKGLLATTEEEAERALREALATPGPVLVDCRVTPDELVYPMVAPGKGIHEMVGVKP
ncbi:acetolactate synthase large subunit [Alicyclobacillus cellulosilyticus]|uniref:Acetolactate synthase n=1 Tax=Alicyclobacillus cellulosilyticus TaxID=1003997 RepID=A0A917NI65_9BACL|nr:acetolactate synthase large subunit [Alicyclobacillus cellulosilyticus]GGJ02298.1 acetolactate synthase large subunit [Alicyclobacillus cellulosilyticus]